MKIFIIALLQLISLTLIAQITQTQNFEIDKSSVVVLNLDGQVEVEEWFGNDVVVETTISVNKKSDFALSYAINKGYYKLVSAMEGRFFTLEQKQVNETFFAKGEKTQIETTYKVLIPNGVKYETDKNKVSLL